MMHSQLIDNTVSFVKEKLAGAEGGHDWFHIERVYRNAILIANGETCDLLVVQLAALLHDIADSKFHDGDETVGPGTAREFLSSQDVSQETIDHVVKIIENVSYKGGHSGDFHSTELDIVRDADRLDALGAIGIARAFNYGGHRGRMLYDPAVEPKLDMTKEEYKKSTAPTINHFYEKLLRLKDLMATETGRSIAENRHEFMEKFLAQFYDEWNGRA